MIKRLPLVLAALAAPFFLAAPAHAQTPSFVISYSLTDGNAHTLSDGTAVAFPSVDIGATTTAVVSIANQGTGPFTVSGLFVAGTGFQIANSTPLPAAIAAGQVLRFGLVFAPTQAGSFSGTFRIDVAGRSISGTLAGGDTPSDLFVELYRPRYQQRTSAAGERHAPIPEYPGRDHFRYQCAGRQYRRWNGFNQFDHAG